MCRGRGERVGLVRLDEVAGPILWLRSADSDVPDRAFPLNPMPGFNESIPELRCPLCGVPLQVAAIRSAVEESRGRSRPGIVDI
jgi:hypothetical protein